MNVLGLLLTSQAALKHFGPEGGSIINISSGASTVTPPNTRFTPAQKGAVDAVTRTLAKELGPRNIRVNALNPGMVITEGVQAGGFDKNDFRRQLESQTPPGPHRPDRGHRASCGLSRLFGFPGSPAKR